MRDKIKLLKDIKGYYSTFKAGTEIEVDIDDSDTGFNEDGTFTLCQGQGIYIKIPTKYFEVIKADALLLDKN